MKILDTIGNTPLVKLGQINRANVFAKLEYFNPGGSIKDRAALYMIKDMLPSLKKNALILEATSGNTGIGLALVAREFGLRLIITMPENMSKERIRLIKSLGAEVILTDASLGMKGSIDKVEDIAKTHKNAVIVSQFDNMSNVKAHYETTAKEIVRDLPNIDWVISAVGSGGTIMGIKKYFINNDINAKVCAVEPYSSPVLSGGKPGRHVIAGIGANFIPSIIDISLLDKIIKITDDESISYARLLAKKYGIFGGYSSGAAFAAAIKLSQEIDGNIVFIVPDTGMRYLSQDLYEE